MIHDNREIHEIAEGEPFIAEGWNLHERVDCNSLYFTLREFRDEHGFDTEVQVIPETGELKVFPKHITYTDMLDEEE